MPRLHVGAYLSIMKIKLTSNATSLGSRGDVVNVGANLGMGLIGRRQAIAFKGSDLSDKTVKELQDIAKEKGVAYSGLKKADLIKELKESDTTKELKENYKTK